MNMEEQERATADAEPREGATLLALRPVNWEWGEAALPPGVVLESQEVSLTRDGWRYLRHRLEPLPAGWPEDARHILWLTVKCLVLAVGMRPPPRFGDGGWLLLSRPEEIATVSALLLNRHGLHFLNHARHERYARRWPERVGQLRGFLERHGLSPSRVLIDDDLVLELYGVRLARDISYLSLEPVTADEVRCHAGDERLLQHGVDKRTLIEDPRYHFEVDGFRFIAFEQLKRLKRGSHRLGDINDLAMMRALEKGWLWRLSVGRWCWWGLTLVALVERGASRLLRRVRRMSDA